MRTLKIDDSDLTQACKDLRAANEAAADAQKKQGAAKDMIRRRLLELRDVEIQSLPIGEKIYVEKLLLIEIAKQSRFDQQQFRLDHPDEFDAYMKDFPMVKMKPEV